MNISEWIFLLPDVFLSLLIFLGLILQKRQPSEVISGTVKSLLGYNFILGGGKIIAAATTPLGQIFVAGLGITGIVINVEAATGVALNLYGSDAALVMCGGLAVNLLLAKFSRWRYVFTTGHQVLYMACVLVVTLHGNGQEGWWLYLLGSLSLGLLLILSPAMVQKYTREICQNDKVALGHFGSFAYLLSAWLGKLWGKEEKHAEDTKLPPWLGFLRDTPVMLFLTIAMIDLAATAMAPGFVEENLSGGQPYWLYAVGMSTQFTVGFVVISTGIRWLVDEIVPAVRGIANAWIKGAIPTVDCPLVFPYAPNALLIGFLSSLAGGILSMAGMLATGLPVILPSAVPHFFCGATAGIYGNATGGLRGAITGGFVNGVLISCLPLVATPIFARLGQSGVAFADTDFNLAAMLLNSWLNRAGAGGSLVILVGLIILSVIIPAGLKKREHGSYWFENNSNNKKL